MPQESTSEKEVLPVNWPSEITYLRQPTHSSSLTPAVLKSLNTPTRHTVAFPKFALSSLPAPVTTVLITPITAITHPARGAHGLLAARHLGPNTFILPYIGHMHTRTDDGDSSNPTQDHASSNYDISLDRELGVAVDAAHAGNEARFINDYRNVKERPNAEFRDIWVQIGPGKWERWIGVFVLHAGKAGLRSGGIKRGEEILVSYGKGFWRERESEEGDQSNVGDRRDDGDAEQRDHCQS